ncbi:MAG: flagellar filament capping protein FliD [Burkholderiales bacterium]
MATLSAPGIGSNLDVNSIVSQLMSVERQPLGVLAKTQSSYQSQLSAYASLRGALTSFQSSVQAMDSVATLQAVKASSSDTTILTVSTAQGAALGAHDIEVTTLAAQHKVNSAAFTDAASTVGTGLITFQFGGYDSGPNSFTLNGKKSAQNVIIGDAQNSLAGIRDAVNGANIGVSASIVNDGSGSRLVFAAKDSGAANSLKITVADADGMHTDNSGLSRLAFDPTATVGNGKNLTQSVAARDAALKVDGINVTSSSNSVTDAIEGVTLNLVKTNVGGNVSVQVSRDSSAVQSSVSGFVRAYNDFNKTVANMIAYDAGTKQRGALQGDTVAVGLQQGLRNVLNSSITALGGNVTRLTDLGVAFQKDGTLALDAVKLQSVIDKNFDAIGAVFSAVGKSSDTRASYASASAATRPGNYAVAITQAATRGALAGAQAAGLTITAGVNDSLSVTVDGTSATVTLGSGTYASAAALAGELQSRINGNAALIAAGSNVAVSESSGIFNVTSTRFGATSAVTVQAGAAASNLFGASPVATTGVDVAGTINGATASGDGQMLTGASNDASAGLALKITASAPTSLGSVQFSRGYASQLKTWATDLLASKGALASRVEALVDQAVQIGRIGHGGLLGEGTLILCGSMRQTLPLM